ncbi:hypothetical protein EYC80_000809 [Monilinia laxa]|uniref:Hydrophobic surface binding protein A n=1 Tax=Monilinia laxa TaxID=61186 RepID=A0A5N6K7B6_MONLA|nr:hypothetical protein EYC80_000809 [Monilinia laxa]
MPSIKSLLLCATGTLAFTGFTQIETDISAIDKNIQTLTTQATSYTGGLTDGLAILNSLSNIYSSFMQGATDASDLPASFSESDAQSLIDYTNSTVLVDSTTAVKTLEGKKEHFQEVQLAGSVATALSDLLAGHQKFTEQVVQRTPENLTADAMSVLDLIIEVLKDGIAFFEN